MIHHIKVRMAAGVLERGLELSGYSETDAPIASVWWPLGNCLSEMARDSLDNAKLRLLCSPNSRYNWVY